MNVFLSWSGEKSKAAAEVFRRWLPCVLQSVRPWMSDRDIGAGARWGLEVGRALEQTKFGILFVTDTNFSAPWLLFEAGALAKALDEAFVCPYLIGLEPGAIPAGPLTQFQAKRAVKAGTLDLVTTLNRALSEQGLADETLRTIFEKFWPDLEAALQALPGVAPSPGVRPLEEMVAETLSAVRALSKAELPRWGPELSKLFEHGAIQDVELEELIEDLNISEGVIVELRRLNMALRQRELLSRFILRPGMRDSL